MWTLAEEDLEHHEGVVWMQLVARVDHHLAIHHLICKRDIKPVVNLRGVVEVGLEMYCNRKVDSVQLVS